MPRSLTDAQFGEFTGHNRDGLPLAVVWGGSAGAAIGASISLTMGFFNSAAILSIFTVVLLCAVIGALFAYVLFNLLSDSFPFGAKGKTSIIQEYSGPLMGNEPIYDHMALKAEKETKIISNQEVMAKIHTMRSVKTSILPVRQANAEIFDIIVAAAHKTDAGTRR